MASPQSLSRQGTASKGFSYIKHHVVYWRRLSDGDIGIVAIMHERMHQIYRFKGDFRD